MSEPTQPTSNFFDTSTFAGTIAALLFLAGPWADIVGAWVVEHSGVALPVGYGFTAKTTLSGIILKLVTRWHMGSK